MQELQYPIGKFKSQPSYTAEEIKSFIQTLAALPAALAGVVAGAGEEQLDQPYRPGGWSVRQVIHHIADSHLNAYIRTKWALTEDHPTIKAYHQDAWAGLPDSLEGPVDTSLDIIRGVHRRWVFLLRTLTPEQLGRTFFHPESQRTFTIPQVLALYAWHSGHHLAHVQLGLGKG